MVGYSQFSLGGLSPGSNFFSYSDADGDGLKNFEDSDPANMDIDGDSILNWNEAPGQMNDPYNGTTPPPLDDPGVIIGGNWYPTGTLDSDGDGTPDQRVVDRPPRDDQTEHAVIGPRETHGHREPCRADGRDALALPREGQRDIG